MSVSLSARRILLIIGGGIAAYKTLDLVRRARERGALVRAVMTEAGKEFVTPLSVASLTGERVFGDLFSLTDEAEMGHIELSRSSDLVVAAPATADLIARLANGIANDLASTLLLATDKKVLMAPAMNLRMWLHPATRRNVETLRRDGVLFVGPNDGDMACGEYGPGRMAEPMEIIDAIARAFEDPTVVELSSAHGRWQAASGKMKLLEGKRVVVTSGPTHEPIDPLRYIANRSSGRQGYAIANAAAQAGADVTLIAGPVSIPDPAGVKSIHVETAREMLAAVETAMPADIFVAAAAVADWRVATVNTGKLKKRPGSPPALALVENPDILSTIAHRTVGRPALVIGFAAETDEILDNARGKLALKGCDIVVANNVSPHTGIMGGKHNAVHLVTHQGVETWPLLDKDEVARRLVELAARRLGPTT